MKTNTNCKDILKIAFALIFTIPFVIIGLPFLFLKRKKLEKKYTEYLGDNGGMNFFCYNNRKNSKAFIENEIIPNLKDGIEIVYLNGKQVESEYNKESLSEALYNLKNYSRFPHLMKIRDGKLIDKSINNLFYNVLNMNKTCADLLDEIHGFFEIE